MPAPRKVIITSAVTGAIHTPSMSKYLPVSLHEIAEAAIGAAEAGAAVVHMHAQTLVTAGLPRLPSTSSRSWRRSSRTRMRSSTSRPVGRHT
jgi:uncharacterized protein (DUF849 family)